MASKVDVSTHLTDRRTALQSCFTEWKADLSADQRADLVQAYFKEAALGESERVGSGSSVYVAPTHPTASRPSILVIGRHDTSDLATASGQGPAAASLVGPGLASRLGPTVAFGEGVQAAHAVTGDDQVNVSFLSLGESDSLDDLSAILPQTSPHGVFLTNAACWSPHQPTITTGARGTVVAELSLRTGDEFDDYLGSGALRNPLVKMTQLIGALRNSSGRISLPGFYDRALAPDDTTRAALLADEHDPNAWTEHLGLARFGGRLSSLERASLWPGLSVLDITASSSGMNRSPSAVTATVAFYLVPDQRHSEVEAALRSWFLAAAPEELRPAIKVLSSTRPYRSSPDDTPVAAQARAAYRLYGRRAALVPSGGPAGAGEVAYSVGAPVAFAGVVPPSSSFGTRTETMPWSQFEAAVALAAETCLQLRRA